MTLAYLLLLLVPVLAVAYLMWDYRRKTAQRDAARADRLQDVMDAATPLPRTAVASTPAAAPVGAAGSVVSYVQRERLLSPAQTLLYYLLRSGLPDHQVFAQMSLASVLDTAPNVAEHARAEMARRLVDHRVDFVISDRRMRPLAVIKLIAAEEAMRNELSSTQRWLAEAGLRYIELDARELPRKDAIRAIVLGDVAAPHETAAGAALSE